ncbi:hypothetical protein NMS_1967 [Nonlabens marinus S1-08]|uniref:Uncharacterized protein n=1 Tax=Nonlabens marinus S1-08 TaxID=1454201 RepID=W8W0A3_9FLAO|nr:hypothetical protein NMS_1967 [Nonlabens marinus S1-08]
MRRSSLSRKRTYYLVPNSHAKKYSNQCDWTNRAVLEK